MGARGGGAKGPRRPYVQEPTTGAGLRTCLKISQIGNLPRLSAGRLHELLQANEAEVGLLRVGVPLAFWLCRRVEGWETWSAQGRQPGRAEGSKRRTNGCEAGP